MRSLFLVFMATLFLNAAHAAELSINDLPNILQKLRGCGTHKGVFSTTQVCKISNNDMWAAIDSEGQLTLFAKRSYGDTTYARGKTVTELLQDFATQINKEQTKNKHMLEVLAPYLVGQ